MFTSKSTRLVIVLALSAFSCVPVRSAPGETETGRLPISVLTNLARGISLEEVTKTTGTKPQHQFTARLETNDFLCVKLSFERPRGYLYFLFRDGELASIQTSPAVEFVLKTNHGIRVQQPKPVHPEVKMNKLIHGRDLLPDEIVEKFEQWSWGAAQRAKNAEPLNILPAFIIVSPAFLAQSPARARAAGEAARLAEKFDPFKIKLGMTAEETKAALGDPEHRHGVSSNHTWHCYGSRLSGYLSVHVPQVWVSVVFCDGKATRVFSHDFYHKGPLELLR